MAEQAGGEDEDLCESTEELKSLVDQLRSVGREMSFMLSMVANIAAHVGPKMQPTSEVTHLKPGSSLEAVAADMHMMYSLFADFTPHLDRKLRSFHLNVEELEERIKELEKKRGLVACGVSDSGAAEQTSQTVQEQQRTPLRFFFTGKDRPVKKCSKLTVTVLKTGAPELELKLNGEETEATGTLILGDNKMTSSDPDGGTSCKVSQEQNTPSDAPAVMPTPPSSDVLEAQTLATTVPTSATVAPLSKAADTLALTPLHVSATEPTDCTHSSDSQSNLADAEVKEPLSDTESAEDPPSPSTDSNLSTEASSEPGTESSTMLLPISSDTQLPENKDDELAPSAEAKTKSKENRVVSSLPTAKVTPRVSPASSVEVTESVPVTSSSSVPTESSQSQSSSALSPVVDVSDPSPSVAEGEAPTSSASSQPQTTSTPSPVVEVTAATPTVVASHTETVTSSTPTRATQSYETQTLLTSSSYSTPPTYGYGYSSYFTPTYESRTYSTSSTASAASSSASAASSSSSGGTPTSTKKYESFVSEPMGNKPVTKVGGVGTTNGSRLRASGYTQASDLQAKFESVNGDRQSFNTWFRRTTGGNSRHANDCYNSLNNYRY